jgi:hypothetical protein
MPNEMKKLIRELPRDRHAFQKKQRRMYDCQTCPVIVEVLKNLRQYLKFPIRNNSCLIQALPLAVLADCWPY